MPKRIRLTKTFWFSHWCINLRSTKTTRSWKSRCLSTKRKITNWSSKYRRCRRAQRQHLVDSQEPCSSKSKLPLVRATSNQMALSNYLCQPEIWIYKAIARYPRFMKVERASIPLSVTSHRRGYQTIHSCRGTPSPTRCLLAFLARKTCLAGWRCLRSMRLKWARHKMGKHWSLRSWIWTQVVILIPSTTNMLRSL